MTKEIPLTQGKVALVDDEDYDYLMQFKWCASYQPRNMSYVARRGITLSSGKRSTIQMHREIMGSPVGLTIDHINHDTLDNRKENLRICTNAENCSNTKKHRDNTTGYKGVFWNKHAGKYTAAIRTHGELKYLGLYDNPIDAALAYDKKAIEDLGEFANVNLKKEDYT